MLHQGLGENGALSIPGSEGDSHFCGASPRRTTNQIRVTFFAPHISKAAPRLHMKLDSISWILSSLGREAVVFQPTGSSLSPSDFRVQVVHRAAVRPWTHRSMFVAIALYGSKKGVLFAVQVVHLL